MRDVAERKEVFERLLPGAVFIDPSDPGALERYASERGWIASGEKLQAVAKAGEGNMNLTLRVVTSRRSFILKQARPWVEKYPDIQAPADRALVEIAFYEAARSRPPLERAMPALLGSDRDSRVLVLDDLGEAQDFLTLYAGARLSSAVLEDLVAYLAELHRPFSEREWDTATEHGRGVFENRAMRALNHEHIFRLPLAKDNGLDLDGFAPGLQAAAEPLKQDRGYVDRVTDLGRLYLEDGDSLVHGDYFPGSWLSTPQGVRVIDPEFCFLGTPAFDLGFMLGHFHLARQPAALGERLLARYRELSKTASDRLVARARQFAGVEIMRRLIGVAQLPLPYGVDTKVELLDTSRALVLS